MALQDIFRALDEQADRECKETLANAQAQAEAIVADAREEGERIRQRKLEAAESVVGVKAAKIVNAAKLENRRDVAAVKERAINEAFDAALQRLGKLRETQGYEDLFRKLAEEALATADGPVEVFVDPRDEKVAAKVLGDLGVQYRLDTSMSCCGGLVVVLGDGRVFRRNTLDARLEKARLIAQSQVAEILFA
jgi:vacuolar-type H+-ATPase subunit E/Vma4